jgi:cell division protein FtsZ
MQFEMPKQESSIIKVFGVGGGGSNAVSYMYSQGIEGVDFYVCNTDQQALDNSPVENKIQIGINLTQGRGAGSKAEVGHDAVLENLDEIREILNNNTKMIFITAGMGGGTGTGAAPVIAKLAKDMGILTVGIVTYPFAFEGKRRSTQAQEGLERLRESVDTLLVITNDKLREVYGNLTLKEAFSKADNILTTAAKGIAEIITVTGYVNIDFEDVRTVMTDSGVAIMGSAVANGENRAIDAVQTALASPLLNDNNIEGANHILLYIASSSANEVLMDEITEITDYIQDEAGLTAEIIWGTGTDDSLDDNISVTLIATGFNVNKKVEGVSQKNDEKVVHVLDTAKPVLDIKPLEITIEESKNEVLNFGSSKIDETNLKSENLDELKNDLNSTPLISPIANPVFKAPVPISTPKIENIQTEINEIENELPDGWGIKRVNLEDNLTSEAPKEELSLNQNEVQNETSQSSLIEEVKQIKRVYDLYSDLDNSTELNNEVENNTTEIKETPKPVFQQEIKQQPTLFSSDELDANLDTNFSKELDEEERLKKSQERIGLIRKFSERFKTPSSIDDLEKEPAFVRRKIRLDNIQHSSDTNISRTSLDNNNELRSGNSFLHDNVD